MIKSLLKSNSGISLLEIMVAGGLMVALGVGMMRMTQDSQKAMKKVSADGNLIEFGQSLKRKLSTKDVCMWTMRTAAGTPNVNVGGARNFTKFAFPVNFGTASQAEEAPATLRVGEKIKGYPDFTVRRITLLPFVADVGNNGKCTLELELERQDNSVGARRFTRKLPLFCSVAAGNNLQECYATGDASSQWVLRPIVPSGSHLNYMGTDASNRKVSIGNISNPTAALEVEGEIKSTSQVTAPTMVATGVLHAPQICISGVCRTNWPTLNTGSCQLKGAAVNTTVTCDGNQVMYGAYTSGTVDAYGNVTSVTSVRIYCCAFN